MREHLTEVLVGAAVLAVALGFLVYTTQTTGVTGAATDQTLTASFRSAEGVTVGTDIRLAGVKIGTVTGLDLNTETYRADVTLSLAEDVLVPDDSVVVVASEGLLGGTFVEIVPGGSFEYYANGDQILNTQGAVSVIGLLTQFVSGGESAE